MIETTCYVLLLAFVGRVQGKEGIDMTHIVSEEDSIAWPTAAKFTFVDIFQGDIFAHDGTLKFYYEGNSFSQAEHSGTHLDAPSHFYRGKWRTHEIPLNRLSGEACVINIEEKAAKNPDARLEISDLTAWEEEYGQIPPGAIVVMFSGHGKHYGNRTRYFGYPPGIYENNPKDTDHLHFPGFHEEAAEWLTRERNIHGVGVDSPSVDFGQSKDFKVHQILAKNNLYGLENLANVDKLPSRGYTIYAMVHKIKEGSGGPARVFAMPTSGASVTSTHFLLTLLTLISSKLIR